jgi:hypothetical protein
MLFLAPSIHSILIFDSQQAQQGSVSAHAFNETLGLNLTQVHTLYSNVLITHRTETSSYITVTHNGPYNQTAWTVIFSPWKPLQISSDNTTHTFTPLNYDPTTMSTNPITDTQNQYAWSYDHLNHVLFIKLLLVSTETPSIFYALPRITNFVSNKTTFTTNENITMTQIIYGNYSAQATINWMTKLTITDSNNNSFAIIDREITLQNNQTITLQYSIQPLNSGTYTATAQIIDPANGPLSTQELTFNVTLAPPISTWVIGILVIITVTILAGVYYYQLKKPLKRSQAR